MGDSISMSISVDSHSDETLNRGPLALLLWQRYEFRFGINIVHFSIFNFQSLGMIIHHYFLTLPRCMGFTVEVSRDKHKHLSCPGLVKSEIGFYLSVVANGK